MSVAIESSRLRAWVRGCAEALAAARAEIDALNVFPVADSDTGTNVYLTVEAGYDALNAEPEDASVAVLAERFVMGALTGAQGNSGVIVAQLMRGVWRTLREADAAEPAPVAVADALQVATRDAYRAVDEPQEGTILTVIAAAAAAARERAEAAGTTADVIAAAAAAARIALAETPTQLAALAEAGVVDAGGRALVVMLDVTAETITGRRAAPPDVVPPSASGQRTGAAERPAPATSPGYEVMYLLDAPEAAVDALRAALSGLGDSLVVVGGEGLWNVHVHVQDAGAAIEAGMAAGRPYRIQVTSLDATGHAHSPGRRVESASTEGGAVRRAVVTAVSGPGLIALAREAGALPIDLTTAGPVSETMVTAPLDGADVDEVILLPNQIGASDPFEAVAKQLRDDGVRVAVLPTESEVQGIAALAVHDPARDFDDDVAAMSAAAAHTRHGAIVVAAEPGAAETVGSFEIGDVLGIADGEVRAIGSDHAQVAVEILRLLDAADAEMVTLVTGVGCPAELTNELERHLDAESDVDLVVYDGGQDAHPLLIAVE